MRAHRSLIAVVPATAILLALVGCVPLDETDPGAEPTTSASSTPRPTYSATSAPTLPPGSEPVTLGCDELISPQTMYDFNPNFGLQSDFVPASGSIAELALEQQGVACSWINQTSGETIDLSVAHLSAENLTALKNELVASSNSVPTYGVEGYFLVDAALGTAQAFPDPFWVTLTSSAFLEPGDVAPLMAAVVTALG